MAKKKKNVIKKGKKPHKNKPTSKRYKMYKIEGDKVVSRGRGCPRCGPGIFLAISKAGDREYCGKCHYTNFLGKKDGQG
jgi:ubiquitin-small subunit ribosomal protein S27Ae